MKLGREEEQNKISWHFKLLFEYQKVLPGHFLFVSQQLFNGNTDALS